MRAVRVEGTRGVRATDKAVLVRIGDREVWVPQSVIHADSEVYGEGHDGALVLATWFAEREEIEGDEHVER